ncbi:M23 family metallopeptidase [Clostridium oceanicum]|uniref:M23 family metallopeptidase n=1 Tax=Clostridium oceanicum TaxID=1543 RepID=A0ABN1JPY0_9CLOT
MEKKPFKKTSKFFKREGFYVILFVCLCVIAVVAGVTVKNSKQVRNKPIENKVVKKDTSKDTAKAVKQPTKSYENALQVKKEDENTKPKTEEKTQEKDTAKVSKQVQPKFIKPVEGTIARVYSEDPVFWNSTSSYRPNLGMDIKTNLGKSVLAVEDGKVENVVSSSQDGVKVIINHQSGLKSVYSNLAAKTNVKKGQAVKKGDVIGKVGKTTLRSAYEKYGDHLHFAMMKGNNYINPSKYIKY